MGIMSLNLSKEQRRELLIEMQAFQSVLNQEPNPAEIKINASAGGSRYLPISYVQMTLDELFFGQWSTRSFTSRTIGNEIVGEIELHVFHPVSCEWLTRTGSAAEMIRMQKGAGVTEFDKKIHNALGMDYPHLEADCIRSAAAKLGKIFGRDLNRKFTDTYKPAIMHHAVINGAITTDVDIKKYNDSRKEKLYELLEQARCSDEYDSHFRIEISQAQTDAEISHLRSEIAQYLPQDHPDRQFKHRSKIQ